MPEKIRAEIVDSCYHVPEEVITNEFFEALTLRDDKTGELTLKTSDEWIMQMIGIKERRRSAPNEYSSDLAIKAVNKMLENSPIKATDLDGILVATSTPDRGFPPTANLVQKGIGARTDIFADDIGSACSSFLAAMFHAQNAIEAGKVKYVLVMATETLTKIIDYTNSNCPIFGDGAAGFVLGPNVEGKGFMSVDMKNDYKNIYSIYKGKGEWAGPRKEIIRPGDGFETGTLRMPHGPRVLKAAVNGMAEAIKEAVRKAGWQLNEVDLALCHQANIRIIEGEKRIFRDYPNIHFYNNITNFGNISGVTCPLGYCKAKEEGLIKDGTKIVFAAFGSGDKIYAWTYQN